jgi:hypothetical protein
MVMMVAVRPAGMRVAAMAVGAVGVGAVRVMPVRSMMSLMGHASPPRSQLIYHDIS